MKVRNSNLYMTSLQIDVEEIVRLQQKGLITIPKKFRIQLNIAENDLLRLKNEKGRIVLEPVRTLPYPVRSYTMQEINEFIALDARETKVLKKKKIV